MTDAKKGAAARPQWLVPLVLSVALFMENMDSTVIATSLPAIAADIGTTPIALKLAFTAYFLALAIFIPISAWAGDRFGPTRVFRAAILVFMLGSLGCAFATSLEGFVAARFLGGMGGAMMTPLARLMLYRITPRAGLMRATATMTIPAVVAPLVGPLVGGALTTFAGWQWIFLVNLPVGLAGIVAVGLLVRDVPPVPVRALDRRGFVLLAAAFSGLMSGLSLVSLPILPVWAALALTAFGLASGGAYLRHAARHPAPLLDPALFRDPVFRGATTATMMFLIGAGAVPFLLPLMLQLGFGLTAYQAGAITFAGGIGAISAKLISTQVFASHGFRNPLILAVVLSAMGLAIKGWLTPETPHLLIAGLLVTGGVLRSLFFTGQHVLTISEIPAESAGAALALTTVLRPIATALGVALAGGVLEQVSQGGALTLDAFHMAFFVLACFSAAAILPLLRLPAGSGGEMSGHVLPGRATP
ncbi:MFS transporter [Paracoccus sp. S3-43]|uniref:MFS transporter n=1 Tax=Paracoccus sp. S3-43 TaxID=3030011 RepID=UPI0023AF134F|nr:MFS transporter [Paracoccus sp. S3-43]WEF25597.1 MFS transporter [Paracoccus sp. S3-43]